MAVLKVPTNFNIDVEFEVPEFYRRMLALIIDMAVEFFYFRIMVEILDSISFTALTETTIFWVLMLPVFFYHLLLEITMNGQSLGKKIMGLRVVNENGGKPSISQYLIRWFLRLSDLWIIIVLFLLALIATSNSGLRSSETTFFLLGALGFFLTDLALVVTSKKGQRIGDILAHTILIRTNPKMSIEETVFQEVADSYVPSFPQIMQLSDKDINAIKSILETAKKKTDFNMAATASEKIKAHLKIDSPMEPFDFLEVLLKDYNYLSVK